MAQAAFTIYSLTDKHDHIARYIGVSNDPVRRYKEHISRDDGGSRSKEAWIAGLARLGMVPEVNFIDGADTWNEALHLEAYWIQYYLSHGAPLLNKMRPKIPAAGVIYQEIKMTDRVWPNDQETMIQEIARCVVQGRFQDISIKDIATLEITATYLAEMLRNHCMPDYHGVSFKEVDEYEASIK